MPTPHITSRAAVLFTLTLLWPVLHTACSSNEDPEPPTCAMDSECQDDEICTAGECKVEETLCASSAECEEGLFCVPRDKMGGKTACDRVVRCDEVSAMDVSALCRKNNGLMASEQFTCDVANPSTPTCVREDKPMMDMGTPDMPDMPAQTECQTSEDCIEPGEYCLMSEPGVCGVPSSCDDVVQPDRTTFCTDQANGKVATCNQAVLGRYTCNEVNFVQDVFWIKIEDVSVGDACDQTAPGADIMGVRLRSEDGDVLGWADAGNESLGDSGTMTNRYDTAARLDGQANGLNDTNCPPEGSRLSELTPPPFSLGCGGWVLLRFVDEFGATIELFSGMTIEVLEYGSTCGGAAPDLYKVLFCSDSTSANDGLDESCVNQVGEPSEGYATFELGPMSD